MSDDIQSYSKILPGTVLNNNLSPSYLQTFMIDLDLDLLLKKFPEFFLVSKRNLGKLKRFLAH